MRLATTLPYDIVQPSLKKSPTFCLYSFQHLEVWSRRRIVEVLFSPIFRLDIPALIDVGESWARKQIDLGYASKAVTGNKIHTVGDTLSVREDR